MIVLYLGPNTVLPLASILAAVIGFLLIAPRFFISIVRRGYQKVAGLFGRNSVKTDSSSESPEAHQR